MVQVEPAPAARDVEMIDVGTIDKKAPTVMDANHWVTLRRNVVIGAGTSASTSDEMDLAVVRADAVLGLARLGQDDKAPITGISGIQDVLTVEL